MPYKRDDILQKRPIILRSLLIEATPGETQSLKTSLKTPFAYNIFFATSQTQLVPER